MPGLPVPLGVKLKDVEKLYIITTLRDNKGNKTHTAKSLGIGLRTLQRKLKSYGVGPYETLRD